MSSFYLQTFTTNIMRTAQSLTIFKLPLSIVYGLYLFKHWLSLLLYLLSLIYFIGCIIWFFMIIFGLSVSCNQFELHSSVWKMLYIRFPELRKNVNYIYITFLWQQKSKNGQKRKRLYMWKNATKESTNFKEHLICKTKNSKCGKKLQQKLI